MSDSLRVRLEFKGFSNPELRNSLLSFKKNETKTVKSLQQLIQKRFHLKENILLLIDGFVMEATEPIDVVRDNDLILIEPKIEVSLTKVKIEPKTKTETKVKSEPKSSSSDITFSRYFTDKRKTDLLPKTVPKFESEKSKKLKTYGNEMSKVFISSDSSSSEEPKVFDLPAKSETKVKPKIGPKCFKMGLKSTPKTNSKPSQNEKESIVKEAKEPEIITSMRDIPVRKAFQNATTSMKKRPQTSTTIATSDTPKPKKRRFTKEASEPVDRFSPIIILERQHIHTPQPDLMERGLQMNGNTRKQSARKSFPNSSRNTNNKNNCSTNDIKIGENGTKNEKELPAKPIDFENYEPLVTIPEVEDIIAFKMLTLSVDGNGYEASLFKIGSVICVNKDSQMVDILLQDVIKRNNLHSMNKSDEQILSIHSLKINWSTVLEPKLIQRQSEPELIVL